MKINKNWIKEHKKELIMSGVMVVISVAGGVYIYKLNGAAIKHERDIQILKDVMSERVLSSLKSTLTRKLRYAEGRLSNGIKEQSISKADIKLREEEIEFFTNELLRIDEAVRILND